LYIHIHENTVRLFHQGPASRRERFSGLTLFIGWDKLLLEEDALVVTGLRW